MNAQVTNYIQNLLDSQMELAVALEEALTFKKKWASESRVNEKFKQIVQELRVERNLALDAVNEWKENYNEAYKELEACVKDYNDLYLRHEALRKEFTKTEFGIGEIDDFEITIPELDGNISEDFNETMDSENKGNYF